jgi:hypothetical protein
LLQTGNAVRLIVFPVFFAPCSGDVMDTGTQIREMCLFVRFIRLPRSGFLHVVINKFFLGKLCYNFAKLPSGSRLLLMRLRRLSRQA